MGGRSDLPPLLPVVAAEVFCCAVIVDDGLTLYREGGITRGVNSLGGAAVTAPMPTVSVDDINSNDRTSAVNMVSLTTSTIDEPTAKTAAPSTPPLTTSSTIEFIEEVEVPVPTILLSAQREVEETLKRPSGIVLYSEQQNNVDLGVRNYRVVTSTCSFSHE